jgi:membrane protease YdiL (CAAX protease family)
MVLLLKLDLSWKGTDLKTVLPIALTLICFTAYWFISQSENIKKMFYDKNDFDAASVKHIFFTKYMGFLLMGILPLLVCLIVLEETSPAYFGLCFLPSTFWFSVMWIVILSLLVIPLAYISGKKPKNLLNYPQIRAKLWTRKIFYINLIGWVIYLFGYEFLFRGILLIPLNETLGLWPAVAINVAMYSATHIPKGLDETIGAIPLGIVLCLLTLFSGTIWIAFWVHVALAWTNSLTALRFHPEIHYVNWNKRK